MSWGYGRKNGPNTWAGQFPIGNGERQSPIDIKTDSTRSDRGIEANPLVISYEPAGSTQKLTNTGYGWLVNFDKGTSSIRGGPLEGEYQLEQYHCHWGRTNCRGSEHTVDGKRYAAELHLVHFNKRYGTFAEAADKPDGLAVIGVFLDIGEENVELKKVTDSISKIKYKGSETAIDATDPDLFLPNTEKYWTYEGSLTTPPLYESVTWIVFSQPVTISQEQIGQFRFLQRRAEDQTEADTSDEEDDGSLVDNFRPPLDVGARTVRTSGLTVRSRE